MKTNRIKTLTNFDKNHSIFDISDTHEILKYNLEDAQEYTLNILDKAKLNMSKEGYLKAHRLIKSAKNSEQLAIQLSNFILAHPEHNLRVI